MECPYPNASNTNPALPNTGNPNDQMTYAQTHEPSRGSIDPVKISRQEQQNQQLPKRSTPDIDSPSKPARWEKLIPGSIFYSSNCQKLRGWRMGVLFNAGLVTVVLLINVTVTIWAYTSYSTTSGIGTFYKGSCEKTRRMNLWIHLVINLLSTAMLSGSNYTQQCLSSPTRAEVNDEHFQRRWLDIGVPSVRNLWRISRFRTITWVLLGLSSVPLHLLFNSAVFTTITSFNFWSQVVAEDFFDPEIFPHERRPDYPNLEDVLRWDTKEPDQCLSDYRPDFITKFRNVYIVVSGTTNKSRSIIDSSGSWTEERGSRVGCKAEGAKVLTSSCSVGATRGKLARGIPWTVEEREVTGCRVESRVEECKLQFSVGIMTVVILCNLMKVVCMLSTGLQDLGSSLLVTIGDAIDSFIREPDEETKEEDFTINTRVVSGEGGPATLIWRKHRWREAVSQARWCVCAGLCLVAVGVAAILLKMGLNNDRTYMDTDIKSIWSRGIGELNPNSLVSIGFKKLPLIHASILANLPQTILSFLYLMYNAVFTSMLVGREWAHFAIKRRALRVTDPRGLQRSTYWLEVPYRYAIPLAGLSGLLHWLTSQSLFLARIEIYGKGPEDDEEIISTAGYSCGAIICTLGLAVSALVFAEANGWRRYPGTMPVVGACSAAISAACHPPEGVDRKKLALGKLRLGGVGGVGGVGRVTFLAAEDPPEPGNEKPHSGWILRWRS